MAPHRCRKAGPTEITDVEDMITYNVEEEEEELQQDPPNKFTPLGGSPSLAQADLLTSSSPIAAVSESETVNPIPNNVPSTSNISAFPSNSGFQPTSASTSIQDTKLKAKTRARKKKKELLKKINDAIIEIQNAPHKPRKSTPELIPKTRT
ncbi:hypothetical protein TNCV_3305441 [Trichonephila clavipes]|nr:hypothetical protein TNCV_3305441 [Trichonephila clavipes]